MLATQLISIVALFLLLLVTSVFFGPWFALHRRIQVFKVETFIQIVQTMALNLAMPMRALMPLCLIFICVSLKIYPIKESIGFALSLIAFVLMVLTLLVTVIVEVPIVNQIRHWDAANVPQNWESIRDRWLRFHLVRVFASLLAFLCFSAGMMF